MKMDLANFTIAQGFAAASKTVEAYEGAAVDHKNGPCAAFVLNVGTFATSCVMKLQYSEDNSTWVDEPDTTAGNTVSVTLTEAGTGVLYVPNPRGRYSRAHVTLGGTNVCCLINLVGPKPYVDAA